MATESPTHTVPLWINNQEVLHGQTFHITSPSTSTTCWTATSASESDISNAISAAETAFPSWSQTKPAQRTGILLNAATLLEANAATYAEYMSTEMGAEMAVARFFVLPLAVQMLRDIAGRVSGICGSVPRGQDQGRSCIVYKEPYGVTLGIVPWNAPFVFGVRSAASAIATGNTTILKASELTPRCYWVIGKIFKEAGLPDGVLNILTCPASEARAVVNAMITHPSIRYVNFTGSASVGRQVVRVCGENLKPCLMELGGKNSAIVLEDADLEKAARECVAGSFINAGQICMATDRIIVHEAVVDGFLAAVKTVLAAAAESGAQPPEVVSAASKKRLENTIASAVSKGASLISESPSLPGAKILPTIVRDAPESSELWSEENFGPLVALRSVRSEDEAVQMANGTGYGLSASVFTRDLRKGLAIARKIESGAVHINSMTVHDEPALPFGGVKNSGWGRFNAEQGLEEFMVTKAVTWDD